MTDKNSWTESSSEFDLPHMEALCTVDWEGKLIDSIKYRVDKEIHLEDVVTPEVISFIIRKLKSTDDKEDLIFGHEVQLCGKPHTFQFEILDVNAERIQFLVSPCL